MYNMSMSIYDNTCPTGLMRLPQIQSTGDPDSNKYQIDLSKIANNTFTQSDLCYNLCSNGDVPHFDPENGHYYCVAPAIMNEDKPMCLSTDMDHNNNINNGKSGYTSHAVSNSFQNPTLNNALTNLTSTSFKASSDKTNFFCKRPIKGLPTKQTLYEPQVIASLVNTDIWAFAKASSQI